MVGGVCFDIINWIWCGIEKGCLIVSVEIQFHLTSWGFELDSSVPEAEKNGKMTKKSEIKTEKKQNPLT